MNSSDPRIWVLLGSRRGDNNQLLALAEALGQPFETRTLAYNRLWALLLRLFPQTPLLLTRSSRRTLEQPWPDLVLGIGRRSVAVARWIRNRNEGSRTKIVRLGNPRTNPLLFDLVITTRQYPVAAGGNVLLLPLAMSRFATPPEPTAKEAEWLSGLTSPRLLLTIGGETKYWTLSPDRVSEAVARLGERAGAAGGSLIVAGSSRTGPQIIAAVRAALPAPGRLVEGDFPRFPVLMASADEIFVTGDSVSMLSEAILTGRPVGLVPIEQDDKGRRHLGGAPSDTGPVSRRRDLRRFWHYLERENLVGTVEAPVAANIENPVETAARAVRKLLGDLG